MKPLRFLIISFYLTAAVGLAAAQAPNSVIAGKVSFDDGAPVVSANIGVKLKAVNDYSRIQTVFTDKDGKFSASVDAGVYVVITESRCMKSRTENVEVAADRTANVDITLIREDCAEKEAQKELDWKACMQEWSVPGLQISDAEKAELINAILEMQFRFEDHLIRDDYQGIFFSTENLDPARIKTFPGVKYFFLTPQQIQTRADASKERRFAYYAFNLETGSTCAYVGIGAKITESKKNPPKKDPNVYICTQGTSKGYLFRKESGKWKLKFSRG